ncbi:MAG: hypothetical protein JW742_09245 [Candidatus Aminicenantes bacterium]|nr:hypothetical protein [Candidatus Aminicenantes bacterium]
MNDNRRILYPVPGLAIAALVAASAARPAPTDVPDAVRSILQRSCAVSGCHRGNYPAKKLSLEPGTFPESAVGVASRQVPDQTLIDPGAPDKSYLLRKVAGAEGIAGKRMPIGRKSLTSGEIQALRDWIEGLDR